MKVNNLIMELNKVDNKYTQNIFVFANGQLCSIDGIYVTFDEDKNVFINTVPCEIKPIKPLEKDKK